MFQVARLLGSTVAELGETMSASEFGEWCAFLAIDPRPEDKNSVLLAQLSALVAGAFHNPKGGRKPPTANDFLACTDPKGANARSKEIDPATMNEKERDVYRRFKLALLKYEAEHSQKAAK